MSSVEETLARIQAQREEQKKKELAAQQAAMKVLESGGSIQEAQQASLAAQSGQTTAQQSTQTPSIQAVYDQIEAQRQQQAKVDQAGQEAAMKVFESGGSIAEAERASLEAQQQLSLIHI